MTCDWLPLKYAKKDGSLIFCYRKDWDEPCLLRWKYNDRIDKWYFGDPCEYDDYELAEEDMSEVVFLPYTLPIRGCTDNE